MEIGDEITIKGKVVDFDSNPHSSAIKVEVTGFLDTDGAHNLKPFVTPVRFWIHRLDQQDIIVYQDRH